MDLIKSFGTVTLPSDAQVAQNDNFRDYVPRTTRLPGLDGGYDEYGIGRTPREIGMVKATYWVYGSSAADLAARLQTMQGQGEQGAVRLVKNISGVGDVFCLARVNNVDVAQNARDLPHVRQRVSLTWQVARPVWLGAGNDTGPRWGSGTARWGDGVTRWGGTAGTVVTSTLATIATVTPGGNVQTNPRFVITVPAGTMNSATIQRVDANNLALDQIVITGPIIFGATGAIAIDTAVSSAKIGSTGLYGNLSAFNQPWFSLLPGVTNTIRAAVDGPAGCTVKMIYNEGYI